MKQLFLFLYVCSLLRINTYSQEMPVQNSHNWVKILYLETGSYFPEGSIKENISIRQNLSSNFTDQPSYGSISSTSYAPLFGSGFGLFNKRFRFGFSTGLRFTVYQTEITGSSASTTDYFYFRYSVKDGETKFARVKSITETNKHLSIPFEIRYIPFQNKWIGIYARAGIEAGILNFGKRIDIDFRESGMNSSRDIVLSSIDTPDEKGYALMYATIGMQIGKEEKPKLNIEFLLPSSFLSKNNFDLIDVNYIDGFKISSEIPLIRTR